MRSRRRRQSSTCHVRLVELGRPGRPALQHVGPVDGVAVEEVGDVADAREAPASLPTVAELRMCCGQGREPRFVEVLLDHLHQRPHGALGHPGVRFRIGAGRQRQRSADQRPRETGRRCWRTRRPACPRGRRGAPTAAGSATARCRVSAPRRPRGSSGRRAGRRPGRASTDTRASARSDRWTCSTSAEYVAAVLGRTDRRMRRARFPAGSGDRRSGRRSQARAPARAALGQGQDDLFALSVVLVVTRPPAGAAARPRWAPARRSPLPRRSSPRGSGTCGPRRARGTRASRPPCCRPRRSR